MADQERRFGYRGFTVWFDVPDNAWFAKRILTSQPLGPFETVALAQDGVDTAVAQWIALAEVQQCGDTPCNPSPFTQETEI